MQTVGRDLNVKTILTGRVIQRGNYLNVQAELIDVAQASQLWGAQYNHKMTDIFTLQEQIASDISGALQLRLTGEDEMRLATRDTEDPAAYQAYLKGRYHWNRRTDDGLRQAIGYFERAFAADPNYAMAYAGLADAYTLLGLYGFTAPGDAFPQAVIAATKALQLDDTLAEPHTSLGFIKFSYEWDWSGAERAFQRSLELNSDYATGHQWYSLYLLVMGRHDEAIKEVEKAQTLDPLSPQISSQMISAYTVVHRYDQAIEHGLNVIEMFPNYPNAYWFLVRVYDAKGQYADAIGFLEQAVRLSGGSALMKGYLGYLYGLSGRQADAQAILEELHERARQTYISPLSFAHVYTGLGDLDRAFVSLDQAYTGRVPQLVLVKEWPLADHLRPDPRFSALMQKMGLPE